jgi:ABC-type Zn uptake system ZnuABC Zn-binding protein ZnuA
VRRLGSLLVLAATLAAAPGCSKGCGGGGPAARPRVAVSIFPIYDLTRRIAGPDADVSLVLPPGHDEHSFDPTPKEIEQAAKAKVGVMVGLGLDPWMEKLMKDAAPGARIIKVGDRVPSMPLQAGAIGDASAEGGAGGAPAPEPGSPDPHVWLNPQNARLIAKAIAEEMRRADPAHATDYSRREDEVDKSLAALDEEVEAETASWKTRGFVTLHDSFAYFAERYKLRILAVIEPSPGSQPSAATIQAVLKLVRAEHVRAIFGEPQLDPRAAKLIAEEAKIPLGTLDPVGGGPTTDSYEKTIRFDVAQLATYLK